MPSSIAHAAVAVIASPLLAPGDRRRTVVLIAAAAAAAPDLDAIGFVLRGFQPPLPDIHRGVTHSLFVALAAAAIIALLLRWRRPVTSMPRLFGYLLLVVASHGLLDTLTTYGAGVELFGPFSGRRFASPWQPIDGLLPEMLCLWLPALLVMQMDVGRFLRRPSRPAS